MNNFSASQMEKASQKIRLDGIEAKEAYFSEEMGQGERQNEFNHKYETFKENMIDFKQNKTKADVIDNQYKLIQQLSPEISVDDLTAALISQVTLLYMQEVVETAKVISLGNNNQKICAADIVEAVRIQEFNNHTQQVPELERFFND